MGLRAVAHRSSFGREVLDARPHDLPSDLVSGPLDITALRHRTIDTPGPLIAPDFLIPAVLHSRFGPPFGVAFRPA